MSTASEPIVRPDGSLNGDALLDSIIANTEIPPEMRGMLATVLENLPPEMISGIVHDAQRVRALRAEGRDAEAGEMIAEYRARAEESGMGGMFDMLKLD